MATRRGGVGGDRSSQAFMMVVSARGASRLGGATAGGAGPAWRAAPVSRSARRGPEVKGGGGTGPRARRAGESGASG
jgi:hypothetical protein